MDCGAAVAADRDGRVVVRFASWTGGGVVARPQEFLGQGTARRLCASAAGATTGRDRLSAADLVRPERTHRRVPCRYIRNRLLVPLDRRSACLRCDGISPVGARD